MTHLAKIITLLIKGEGRAFLQGLTLSLLVLVMGIALLALSGWFITAAAAAGLLGLGTVFNVFAPSAMVRFLALGRTITRYGERLTTHDATLRALSNLRARLLSGLLDAPYRQLEKLRANQFLNRVTADVDALDGLALRLIIPGCAGLTTIAIASLAVAFLVTPEIMLVILLGYGLGPTLIFLLGQKLSNRPARRAEAGLQALRSRMIDLITTREELIAFGQLLQVRTHVQAAATFQSNGQAAVDQLERRTGFWLEILGWAVVSTTLGMGATSAQSDEITAAQAAIGVFVAMALTETVAPVRRALSDISRMRAAARRVLALVTPCKPPARTAAQQTSGTRPPQGIPLETPLKAQDIQARRDANSPALFAPLSFCVEPGKTVALTGPSGGGKSTVLLMARGQIAPSGGMLRFGDTPVQDVPAEALHHQVALVPQRHALVAGTVSENLRLAAPTASDAALWAVLEATQLDQTLHAKEGLQTRLGFRGAGLSGGEARRLVLARALLRKPRVLLLDEPTEGLDSALAIRVLTGLRAALPDAAILIAAHRPEEVAFADVSIPLDCAEMGRQNNRI